MLPHIDLTKVRKVMSYKKNHLKDYLKLLEWVQTTDVAQNKNFQELYKDFWITMYGKKPVKLSDAWYISYFQFMEDKKNSPFTFEDVLRHLLPHDNRVEASFSSKLLATVNPNQPIWGTRVFCAIKEFGITQPLSQTDKPKQILETVATYSAIENWYSEYLNTPNATEIIRLVDEMFPFATEMTAVKKVDWALYSMGAKR